MNNLTTRKIVLGMLMTLVLAFSVQGIADALTFKKSRTGDLQTVVLPDDEFTIKFSVEPTSSKDIFDTSVTPKRQKDEGGVDIDSSGYEVEGFEIDGKMKYFRKAGSDNVDTSGYKIDTTTGKRIVPNEKATPDPAKFDSLQHHYNDEAIRIQVTTTGTGAALTSLERSGTPISFFDSPSTLPSDLPTDTEAVSLIEETKNRQLDTDLTLSSSITLTGEVAGAGVYTITIWDMTHTDDFPVDDVPGERAFLTFTIYVVPDASSTPLALSTDGDASDAVDTGYDSSLKPISGLFSVAGDVPLTYQVQGSGSVLVKISDREGRSNKKLETSSSAPVFLDMKGSSNKVTVWVSSQDAKRNSKSITFLNGYADPAVTSDDNPKGATGGRLAEPLEVTVKDSKGKAIPGGIAVGFTAHADNDNDDDNIGMFIPVSDTIVYIDPDDDTLVSAVTDPNNAPEDLSVTVTRATPNSPAPSKGPVFVRTDSSGKAQVYFQLGSRKGQQRVTITLPGTGTDYSDTFFRATAADVVSTDAATITIVDGDSQRADVDELLDEPLVVLVKDVGSRIVAGARVTFTTNSGSLVAPELGDPGVEAEVADDDPPHTARFIVVNTDDTGKASVGYNVGDLPGAKRVFATIDVSNGRTREKTFSVNGRAISSRVDDEDDEDDDEDDEDDTVSSVTIDVPPTVTGTAGGTATLTVTAPATATVTAGGLGNTFLSTNVGSFTRSGTTFTSRLTLPNQVADFSLSVFVNNTRYPVTVSVTAAGGQTQTGGRLTVRVDPLSGAPGSTATVTVTATDSSAQPANATVSLTATGGTLASSSVLTGTTGTTTVTLTRGSTVGSENFVTVSGPSGYDSVSGRFVIAGPVGRDMTVGVAENLDDYDGNNQMGSLNSPLAEPLVVEVLDANDNPVENARVRFSTTIGSGRFSPRTPRTDEDGFAETTFTPTSPGRIRVVATVTGVDSTAAFTVQAGDPADALEKVSGDNQSGTPGNALAAPFVVEVQDEDGEPLTGHSVTFTVTAGGGSLSETSATTNANGRAQTTLTLGSALGINSVQASVSGVDPVIFSTNIEPKILVAAANRPVMYWIDNGMLYSLAGAKAAKIAESANGVAVGGGKIYWTSQINPSSGTINSANLDGTDAATLTSIRSVPVGIAVDTAGSKLYWTNARGRIQSANLNGSGIQNVLQNLSAPTDIVVSNGFIYWTEGGNSVRRVNISGQKIAIDVAVNLGTVGGLAVGSGKVYWTEMTSASAGTVNGANLNGTNFKTLATLLSAPMGISVDTAGSKLYWTNARGRVQSANLDGSGIKNVVEGLISASKIAIGGANTETTTVKAATPAKKDNAKYDVNGDGKVDNVDASLVASGLDTGNAKYDVNSDGTVNFLDLLLVFDNRDDNAAAAPAIVGMKLNAIQIDRIEEQIDLLIATNDRSPAAMRTLVYLQQLLATARPEKTQLFANYPNPFNPETWIPYELATDTHVKITIYNTQGVVIRTLQFGHQSAGYYTGRDRAAYWDGRNALGEQVASGLYFYQLETDEMSSMRKMVILK